MKIYYTIFISYIFYIKLKNLEKFYKIKAIILKNEGNLYIFATTVQVVQREEHLYGLVCLSKITINTKIQ